jgi:hypothetical protein
MLSGYSIELVGGSLANDTVSNLMKGVPDNNSFGLKVIFMGEELVACQPMA